ncbi:unnamed protein product [Dibothriocephalus latus]|uniref:Uncharacterized protein n=1 Tax=Dibothriocephalus latus TaxID=60516 RepID=A0A3P7NB23_DIBLA|nr:unnamed protein product [Dibothriocephalus latus]
MLRRAHLGFKLTVRLLLAVGFLSLVTFAGQWVYSPSDTPIITYISPCKTNWLRLRASHETNTFKVSIAVEIANDSHGSGSNINSDNRWVGRHFRRRHYQQRIYTFADLADLPDRHWRRPIPPAVYLLYPQALDMKKVVADIASCRPIPEVSMKNPN